MEEYYKTLEQEFAKLKEQYDKKHCKELFKQLIELDKLLHRPEIWR